MEEKLKVISKNKNNMECNDNQKDKYALERLFLALSSMGYRRMKNGKWGKPFGYALSLATIEDGKVTLQSIFKGKSEFACYHKSGFAFDSEHSMEDFCFDIANIESYLHLDSASSCGEANGNVLFFPLPEDLYCIE